MHAYIIVVLGSPVTEKKHRFSFQQTTQQSTQQTVNNLPGTGVTTIVIVNVASPSFLSHNSGLGLY